MTTEKWVWIGVVIVALLVGGAAWEGIRPKCPPPETVVNIPTQIKWDTVSIPFYPARLIREEIRDTISDTVRIVESAVMDTTAPITATIITPQDTLDALAFANIKTKFRDGAFYDTRLSLSPISVNLVHKPTLFASSEQGKDLNAGLGIGWVQPFSGSGAVQLTAHIPINGWLSATPSGVFGSWTGLGIGIMVNW